MHTVSCPSGMILEIRKLRVKEANMLADQSSARQGTVFDSILSSITTQVVDPGPYKLNPDGSLNWGKVLVGDRFATVVNARVATYGPTYTFDLQCASRACRAKYGHTVDFTKSFVKPFPAESIVTFKAGNLFTGIIPSTGREFYFELQTGVSESRAAKMARGKADAAMSVMLMARIKEFSGVESQNKLKFIENLEMDDMMEIIETMDEADGGVETNIDVICPECGNEDTVNLPFGREFWLPQKKKSGMRQGLDE